MANHVRPIAVSPAERAELERPAAKLPSTPAGLSRRARAVLLMAQGLGGGDRRADRLYGGPGEPDSAAAMLTAAWPGCPIDRNRAGPRR